MVDSKLLSTEAAESRKKSQSEVVVPDPAPEAAKAAIDENVVSETAKP